eukprot:365086-Chlamydomonas_euryale.AAC.11
MEELSRSCGRPRARHACGNAAHALPPICQCAVPGMRAVLPHMHCRTWASAPRNHTVTTH